MKNCISIFILLFTSSFLLAQNISGTIINKSTGEVIEFVNIGILGKSVGTVSNEQGKFSLIIDSIYKDETLLFSSIGYKSVSIKISEFTSSNKIIEMQVATYELKEVVIKPRIFTEKTLGIKTTNKAIQIGFTDTKLGLELGVMMKNKKSAYLKTVNINIASCTYDTLFYRLNVYKVISDTVFQNILKEPLYINISKEQFKETISIDLKSRNIVTEGNFLISLEQVKDLGKGSLIFCCALGRRMYGRQTSQDKWESVPVAGISISVVADVEK